MKIKCFTVKNKKIENKSVKKENIIMKNKVRMRINLYIKLWVYNEKIILTSIVIICFRMCENLIVFFISFFILNLNSIRISLICSTTVI